MDIMKIIGVAFVTAISAILLKSTKPELSFAVTVTGVIVILLFIMDALAGTISVFTEIAQTSGMDNGLLKVLIKIVGVGYLTDFGAGILQDFGANGVADKVSLAGKIVIVLTSFPVLEGLLRMVRAFLEFV